MIYICYIIYRDYLVTYVLTVGDNELAVGDDNNASSEVAKRGAHAGRLREVIWKGLVEEWDM